MYLILNTSHEMWIGKLFLKFEAHSSCTSLHKIYCKIIYFRNIHPSPRQYLTNKQKKKKRRDVVKKRKINKKFLYLRESRQAGRQTRGRFSGAGSYRQLLRGRSTPMEGWKRQFSRGFRENERNEIFIYTHFSMPNRRNAHCSK